MGSSSATLLIFLLAPLMLAIALANSEEKINKGAAAVPGFNYTNPEAWGRGDPKGSACSSGQRQSPIDILAPGATINKTLEPLTRNYHVFEAKLAANGLEVEVIFKGKGGLVIDGKNYELVQMHWHTPSEHRINGVEYAAELHIVHRAADGSRAVVGILHKEGPPSPVLTMLKPQLDELAKKPCPSEEHQIIVPKFKSSFLRKRPRPYYRYPGSLTTPPCDEIVIWNIMAKVKTISREQVASLKAPACEANKNNARPTQPLNGRTVQKYEEL